jgi:hypothetical protein
LDAEMNDAQASTRRPGYAPEDGAGEAL